MIIFPLFVCEKVNWKSRRLFYIIIYFRENWLRNLWSSCVVWLLTGFHAVRSICISMSWCVPIWFTIYKHCVDGINGKVCTIVVQTLLFVDSITNCVEEIFCLNLLSILLREKSSRFTNSQQPRSPIFRWTRHNHYKRERSSFPRIQSTRSGKFGLMRMVNSSLSAPWCTPMKRFSATCNALAANTDEHHNGTTIMSH